MNRYFVKLVREDAPVANAKKNESMLRDLLDVLPTLKKHKLEGEIQTKVRRLRDGRRQKHFTLEVSRSFPVIDENNKLISKEIKASKIITREMMDNGQSKFAALKELKEKIISDIQGMRKSRKPPIENFRFSEGVQVKKLEMCYLEPGAFTKLAHRRVRTKMGSAKSPGQSTDRYIGIEIEIMAKENRDQVCDALFEAGVGKYVHVKHDGSISVTTEYPNEHEITILCRENEYHDVLTKLCKCLNDVLHCRVDKSCGLHVHLDMRHRDPAVPFANLVTMQDYLYAMCPAARKNSKYSIPAKAKKWVIDSNHYSGISSSSYQKYKTIELRMHSGTTQAKKIISWIDLLVSVANAPAMTKKPKNMTEASEILGLKPETVKYVESRIAKFADQHKKIKKGDTAAHLEDVEPSVGALPDSSLIEEQSEVA